MTTTPNSFYNAFVVLNLEDYLETPDDVRKGFNASVAAYQLADIFWFYTTETRKDPLARKRWPKVNQLHIELGKKEPLFITIQSVATVYKHFQSWGGHIEVASPGALWSLSVPRTRIKIEAGESRDDVMVRRTHGRSEVSLTAALKAVVYGLWPSVLPPE